MSLGNWLILGSMLVLLPYFYFFKQAFDSLSEEEPARILHEGALPAWRRVLAVVPIGILVFSQNLYVQLAAAGWALFQLYFDARLHDQKLRNASVDPAYCDRLQLISKLSYAGTLVLVVGLILR